MGNESELGFPQDGEGPVRKVELEAFYIDESSVTNAEFFRFVHTTGYKTEAEIYGWSFVFHSLIPDHLIDQPLQSPVGTPWWKKVDGAYWHGERKKIDYSSLMAKKNDMTKNWLAKKEGYTLIRIKEKQLKEEYDTVVENISSTVGKECR